MEDIEVKQVEKQEEKLNVKEEKNSFVSFFYGNNGVPVYED